VSKNARFYILNNSAKNEPILIIFGAQNPEEISHQKIVHSLFYHRMIARYNNTTN